jgi:ABC-type sugar transport system permease subunit
MSESLTASASVAPELKPNKRRSDGRAASLMIAPNMILFTIFIVIPIILTVGLSFTNATAEDYVPFKFVGLANYKQMLNDPIVGIAVGNTLKFLFYGVVPTILLGFGLALLLNVRFRGIGIIRALYLIPAAMSFAASAIVWNFFFVTPPPAFSVGLFAWIEKNLGIALNSGLNSGTYALPSIDLIGIWLCLPVATILYLAALQRINPSVIEAATIDGAGPIRRVRYIIWPGVRYMTILVSIFTLLQFTGGSFDLINILTPGGGTTNHSTSTLIWYIYYQGLQPPFFFGYAAALSLLLIAMTLGLLGALWGLSRLLGRRA